MKALFSTALVVLFSSRLLGAGILVFDDKPDFLAQTAANPVTTIPSTPYTFFPAYSGFVSGDLSFTLYPADSFRFIIDDWSSRLPGNELAISGRESFDVHIATGPVFSFGFDFVEPENDPNGEPVLFMKQARPYPGWGAVIDTDD